MPTIPQLRTFKRNGNLNGFIDKADTLPYNRTDVTEIQLKWNTSCPPCKEAFWWTSAPQPILKKGNSNKSRKEIPQAEPYKNVMFEKRVIRGTNFGPSAFSLEYDPFDKASQSRRRIVLRKKHICQKNQRNILGTPPPIFGRHHESMQTEKYLEELVLHPPEFNVETQTDLFLEKPPTPPYIPAKIGIDVGTEIGDGELFHFDAEAQPIIDVLVDNTIELSILEVAHEREITIIRQRQQELLAHREAELSELRRLEAEEIRLNAEKERRLHQYSITKKLDVEMQKDIATVKLLQGHIASILPEIMNNLEPATDAFKKQKLITSLCPRIAADVANEVGTIEISREMLITIIREVIRKRAIDYAGYRTDEPSRLEIMVEEERELCDLESIETVSEQLSHCPQIL